jgi:hypothetical protein
MARPGTEGTQRNGAMVSATRRVHIRFLITVTLQNDHILDNDNLAGTMMYMGSESNYK